MLWILYFIIHLCHSQNQILIFCPDDFVLLHGERRGGAALPKCVWRILLTDELQDGSHHLASCCSSCSWLPTSAQGPSDETKLWNLPARGRKQVVETTQSWGILISYRVKIRIRALQNNFQVTLCHTLLWWAEGLAQQYENWHNWVWFKGLHVAEFMDKAAWIWLKR